MIRNLDSEITAQSELAELIFSLNNSLELFEDENMRSQIQKNSGFISENR